MKGRGFYYLTISSYNSSGWTNCRCEATRRAHSHYANVKAILMPDRFSGNAMYCLRTIAAKIKENFALHLVQIPPLHPQGHTARDSIVLHRTKYSSPKTDISFLIPQNGNLCTTWLIEVFTKSRQYKNANIAICVFALSFEIYWTTKVYNLEM